jgi:long-chain acyl-CoA synthetase
MNRRHPGRTLGKPRFIMSLHQTLFATAVRRPDQAALSCRGERLTYGELASRVRSFAAGLARSGVRAGDRVAVHLPTGVDAVVATYAVLSLGAVLAPLNAQIRVRQLRAVLADAGVVAVVTSPGGERAARLAAPAGSAVLVSGQLSGKARRRPGRARPGDLAALFYTSSCGHARKAVMFRHGSLGRAAGALIEPLRLSDDDVVLGCLPLSCEAGLLAVATAFAAGARVVLEPSFAFPLQVLAAMARERVTVLPGVATMFSRMVALRTLARHRLSSVRAVVNLGAPLPVAMVGQLRGLFRWAKVSSLYGLPECAAVAIASEAELLGRPGSLGRALPGTALEIVDAAGVPLPAGSAGELVVRGGALMDGYWGHPEETERRLRPMGGGEERWLFTGDRVRSDADGFLYPLEPGEAVIESRGGRVSRGEVAAVIQSLPGVREVSVLGVDHPTLGEAIKAVVCLEPGSRYQARDVIRHCRTRLEGFMIPQEIEFVAPRRQLRLIA